MAPHRQTMLPLYLLILQIKFGLLYYHKQTDMIKTKARTRLNKVDFPIYLEETKSTKDVRVFTKFFYF